MNKYKSLTKMNTRFVEYIGQKYNNKIKVGEYIVERLIDKKISIGFSYKQTNYTPFFNIVNKFNNFNIVFNSHEQSVGQSALIYSEHTNNIGIIVNTSTCCLNNISKSLIESKYNKIPVLLMSFSNKNSESKLTKALITDRQYFKDYFTINDKKTIPRLLEYAMLVSESTPKGPVHLNICNSTLNKTIKIDDIVINKIDIDLFDKDYRSQNIHIDDDVSLLQYYEKLYDEYDKYDKYDKYAKK